MEQTRPAGGPAPRVSAAPPSAEPPRGSAAALSGSRVLALPIACATVILAFALLVPRRPELFWTFTGAAAALLAWTAAVYMAARRGGRTLALEFVLRRQHWVQACAQGAILLYWGWHVRFVYAFMPLIVAQLIFAYAIESLLTWSRRDTHALGFGPFPIIFSINLFLWFRPEWFYWQFAMILVGYAAKELIRWNREGRSAHIFNPSSFPLGLASAVLILTSASEITLGTAIATTQFYPPHMYLVIFLVALPGQLLFGVARMTLSAVVTLYLISQVHLWATGTYLFYDSHIPLPVFLGMHLLFTDPSTSPRSTPGRILFGAMYGIGTAIFYVLLSGLGVPTFYDKLLPVPLMNLTVRAIDRLTSSAPAWQLGFFGSTAVRRHVAWTVLWAGIFVMLSAVRGVGDRHPGQALPFWLERCRDGNARACRYATSMTLIYCNNGSGWACNEWGIMQQEAGRAPGAAFARACDRGFPAGCANAERAARGGEPPARAAPLLADLPIVLRGTKPPLTEREPARLYAIACEQGWPDSCANQPPAAGSPADGLSADAAVQRPAVSASSGCSSPRNCSTGTQRTPPTSSRSEPRWSSTGSHSG